MPRSRRELVVLCLIAGLTGLLFYRVLPYLHVYEVEIGDQAPEFELSGGVSLTDYNGKLVLLNFWATWCPPCVAEVPSLNNLYEQFRDEGFVVLAISVDEEEDAYKRFLERFGVTFPTVRDPERKVSLRYGTMKYPESYLINRQGIVIRKYINAQDWEHPEIVNYVRSVL